jgi:uracil-DNA glycosylase
MQHLLDMLRAFTAPNVFNPWAESDQLDVAPRIAAVHRGERLRAHFDCDPRFVLIGEAPGYQGCRFSGVPFTSELLVTTGQIPRVARQGRLTTRARPWSEPSATTMWRMLYELGIEECTVLWNAFAWHPFRSEDNPHSNRPPTRAELQAGSGVLKEVLAHFHRARYVAVGLVAKAALEGAGVNVFATVRHPSMGGAVKFREQMAHLGAVA